MGIDRLPRILATETNRPISNIAKMVAIIGSASVEAVSDAYLTNVTLKCLTDLASLGVNIDARVRLLAPKYIARQKIDAASLTDSFFKMFRQQVATEATTKFYAKKEHDRLIFLSDGRCLSPDFSLNNVDNRGSLNTLSPYDTYSRKQWFEQEWENGEAWPQLAD